MLTCDLSSNCSQQALYVCVCVEVRHIPLLLTACASLPMSCCWQSTLNGLCNFGWCFLSCAGVCSITFLSLVVFRLTPTLHAPPKHYHDLTLNRPNAPNVRVRVRKVRRERKRDLKWEISTVPAFVWVEMKMVLWSLDVCLLKTILCFLRGSQMYCSFYKAYVMFRLRIKLFSDVEIPQEKYKLSQKCQLTHSVDNRCR